MDRVRCQPTVGAPEPSDARVYIGAIDKCLPHPQPPHFCPCGEDTGTPVSEDYKVPFKFTGDIEKVTINITEHKLTEEQLEQYRQGRIRGAIAQ